MDPMALTLASPRRWDVFDMLVRQSVTGDVEATGIADSWKTIDPTTWEFSLNPKFVFHDDTQVTAEDVKYSFERALDPAKKFPIAARTNTVKQVTVVDKTTVRFTTTAQDPILLRRVAAVPIFPKAYAEKVGDAEFGLKPIGSGPFKVKEYVPQDRLVLVPFDKHPRTKPAITEAQITQIPEASARVAGLRTGELDVITQLTPDNTAAVEAANATVVPFDIGASGGCRMSGVDDTPVKDTRVRQAINFAVDKDQIAKSVFGGLTKPEQGQVLQPGVFGYNPNVKPYPFDQAKAKQLLAEAGWVPGTKIGIEWLRTAQRDQMVQIIQSQLKEVGVEIELKPITDATLSLGKLNGSVPREAISCGTISTTPSFDGDFALNWFWGQSTARWLKNAAYDEAYAASRTEMDPKKREALLQQAVAAMRDDPPYLFVVPNLDLAAVKKNVKNLTILNQFEQDLRTAAKTQ